MATGPYVAPEPAAPTSEELWIGHGRTTTGASAALTGLGAPSAVVSDGALYFETDASGQVVGQWMRQAGAWAKILGQPPILRASTSATVSVPNNTNVYIPWDAPHEDADGMVNQADKTQIVIGRAGIYAVSCWWRFGPATPAGSLQYALEVNGTDYPYYAFAIAPTSTAAMGWPIYKETRFSVGDTLKLLARQSSGVTMSIGTTLSDRPELVVRYVQA